MIEWIELIGRWSWEAVWIPVGIWTLPALAVLAMMHWRRIPVRIRLDVALMTMVALPSAIVLANLPGRALPLQYVSLVIPAPGPAELPVNDAWEGYSFSLSWLALGLVTLSGGLLAVIGLLRLGLSATSLRQLRNKSVPVDDQQYTFVLSSLADSLGLSRDVDLRHSPGLRSPVSFGVFRPTIVLDHLSGEHLGLVLRHELLHHRRGDILRTWIAEVVRSLFFFHPLPHALRKGLNNLIELDCDAWVISETNVSKMDYASLLMNYVHKTHRADIFMPLGTSQSQIKSRIEAMKSPVGTLRSHPVGTVVGILLLGIISAFAACTDSFVGPENAPGSGAATLQGPDSADAFVIVEEMPTLIGGLERIQKNLQYPSLARNAGVQGRVYLQFVVDTEGVPRDIVVVRGIGAGADEEAVRLVRDSRFTPGKQDGKTVPVKMSLPVAFRLDTPPPPPSRTGASSPPKSSDLPPPAPEASEAPSKSSDN